MEENKGIIYRQDAIDIVMDKAKKIPTIAIMAKDALEKLPSAEQKSADCEECDYREFQLLDSTCCDSCYSAYKRGEIEKSEMNKPDYELQFGLKKVYLCKKHLGEWFNRLESAIWSIIFHAYD